MALKVIFGLNAAILLVAIILDPTLGGPFTALVLSTINFGLFCFLLFIRFFMIFVKDADTKGISQALVAFFFSGVVCFLIVGAMCGRH